MIKSGVDRKSSASLKETSEPGPDFGIDQGAGAGVWENYLLV